MSNHKSQRGYSLILFCAFSGQITEGDYEIIDEMYEWSNTLTFLKLDLIGKLCILDISNIYSKSETSLKYAPFNVDRSGTLIAKEASKTVGFKLNSTSCCLYLIVI